MAFRSDSTPDYIRGVRRVLLGAITVVLVAIFLIWRIDNARVEQLRVSLVDRFVPSFSWTVKPIAATARMITDIRAYSRVYQQNVELRRELQRMQGWREAALQLEQKNARLLALNNVRLNPRLTFVTGEVMADAGSPFRRSAMVNVGRIDGPLPDSEIQSTVERVLGTLRDCYKGAAKSAGKTPVVRLKLSFSIDEGRAARDLRVSGDSLGMGACVKDAASKLRTRVAPDVGTASVRVVVKFQPVGG